jgi:hypothetical protein
MLDHPIYPAILIDATPKRPLETVNEARAYVEELLHERRFSKWREMLERLDDVKNEEDAVEAIGALRELLAMEHLLTG